jgi:apolipoprotein N-acyltransferase
MASFSPPGYVAAVLVFGLLYGALGAAAGTGYPLMTLPAGLVVLEWIRWHAPFGGVPLSSLSLSQARGPLLDLARVGGPLLITGAVALAATAVGAFVRTREARSLLGLGLVVIAVAAATFAPSGTNGDALRVAVVQGGGPQGTLAINTSPAEPFAAHLEASQTIDQPVDLVVWPENVVNIDGPLQEHPWFEDIANEARRIGAPIEVGVVEGVDDQHFTNYSAVVSPDGTLGSRYDKVRRVPFGEYVPLRSVFAPFSGLLPRRDQIVGTEPAVLDVGDYRVAVAISWEIFFPRRVREGVNAGGELVLNPTNGSSYWLTLVQSQQVANSILRATESGRYLLQAAPTGFSAIIDPDGKVLARTGVSEQRVLYDTVYRRTGRTIADRTGDLLPLMIAAAAIAGSATARYRRRDQPQPAADAATPNAAAADELAPDEPVPDEAGSEDSSNAATDGRNNSSA